MAAAVKSQKKTLSALMNQAGISIVEVMITLGIMGILMSGLMTLLFTQQREAKAVAAKLATIDLEQVLLATLADGSVCSFIFTDPSQGTNRSSQNFDATNLSGATIHLLRIPGKSIATAPPVAVVGESPSPYASSLKIQSILVTNISGSGDHYNASIQVNFSPTNQIRPLKPISVQTTLQTDPTSPATAKSIVGCLDSVGLRQWQNLTSARALYSTYKNDTGRDISISVSNYSGAAGTRCAGSISVNGLQVAYAFVNDSKGAAMCNVTALIPPGSSYSAGDDGSPDVTLYKWSELR